MNAEETVIYNDGERLIPGVTHSLDELVRHQSSYEFFAQVIEEDLRHTGQWRKAEVRIVDLGFGVGHGCKTLSRIPGAIVTGVDVSEECRAFARTHYNAPNITHVIADIPTFIRNMPPFDYVVSRGVIEHVPDGLKVAAEANWTKRLMIDVPYNEPVDINHHHVVSLVTERDFAAYPANREILYEEVSGAIYTGPVKTPVPNMIMCVATKGSLPKVTEYFDFPIPAWQPPPGMQAMAQAMVQFNASPQTATPPQTAPVAPRPVTGPRLLRFFSGR
jgi:hypothetical protein